MTGASRCYGFVEFKHSKDASDAFQVTPMQLRLFHAITHFPQHAHRAVLDHAELLVDYERERTMPGWIPRRLGMREHHLCCFLAVHMLTVVQEAVWGGRRRVDSSASVAARDRTGNV